MEKERLLEEYEARGEEAVYGEARRLYESALAGGPTAQILIDYGYLLECHGRNSLRHAVEQYERAINLDPALDKPHWHLIGARAALREPELPVSQYRRRLAAAPTEVREHRFLASALLAACEQVEAGVVIVAGLKLLPDDPMLIELRGDLHAATGDPDGALADWRKALELDPENISAAYSSAFLLESQGRLDQAVQAWQFIVGWNEHRDYALSAEWPRRELERLRQANST